MAVGGVILVAAVVYVTPMVMVVAGMGECGYEPKSQKISPDGRRKAALVEVNCGATTGYATWVVATGAKSAFKYKRDRIAAIEGQDADIEWDGSKLVVFYPRARPPIVEKEHRGEVVLRTLQSRDADAALLRATSPSEKANP